MLLATIADTESGMGFQSWDAWRVSGAPVQDLSQRFWLPPPRKHWWLVTIGTGEVEYMEPKQQVEPEPVTGRTS